MANPFLEYEEVQSKQPGGWAFELLQTAVIALAICIILWLFVVQGNQVDGQSMEPTFHDKELVLTDKVIQHFGEYKNGDVVIFKNETSGNDFIKRLIGLPGDEVSVSGGRVYVNGVQIEEAYLPEGRETSGGTFLAEGETVLVPEGKYFALGDNRGFSRDSRDNTVGLIPKNDLKGRVFLIYWPPKSDNLGIVHRVDSSVFNK
ncbi:signal peptidase I [Candidatus Dojkabacteria bacterium]|uniref:Signal peptidase I n=1 Tax=Candidatus Dojkabacteria bacterium TaxID=2099670 RepID=A0A955L3W6_9BACT|nr:signal peptidase I [Candidatus Dojkabacteria bacterium]